MKREINEIGDIIYDWETSKITEGIHTQEERKTERRRAEQNGDQYPARNDSATTEIWTTVQHSTRPKCGKKNMPGEEPPPPASNSDRCVDSRVRMKGNGFHAVYEKRAQKEEEDRGEDGDGSDVSFV